MSRDGGGTLRVGENVDNLCEDRKLSGEARRSFHTLSRAACELRSQCLKGMWGLGGSGWECRGKCVMPSGVGEILDPTVCSGPAPRSSPSTWGGANTLALTYSESLGHQGRGRWEGSVQS